MPKIEEQIAKIKLWQEECKLVAMFFGAVASVTVFFSNLFKGKAVAPLKAMESTSGAGDVSSSAPSAFSFIKQVLEIDIILAISVILFIVFLGFGIYYAVQVYNKHRTKL